MAGIDAPYRDPREELARALQRAQRPPPAAPLPSAAPIPVGEVREFQQPRLAATPTSAPGGSPEFREAQRSIGAMPAPAEPAAAKGAMSRVASTTGGLVRGALPGVAGAVIGGMQARADAQPQPVDRTITAQTGPGQIPFDPTQSGPAPVAPRRPLGFLEDTELNRNVANAINSVPGGRMVTTAGLGGAGVAGGRLVSLAPQGRLTQQAVAAGNTAQQVVRGAQSAALDPAASQVSTWTDAAQRRANGGELPAPPQGIGDFNDRRFDAARGMTPPETGVIRFDPKTKTYSGTDVKEGAAITGGRPGGRGTGRGNVTTLDTSEGFAADIAQLNSLRAERADREAGFAMNQPGGGLAGIGDSGANRAPSTESRVQELMRAGLSNRQALQAVNQERSAETQAENAQRGAEVQARGQDISAAQASQQQRQQAGIARMQDRTQRDIAALNASRPTAAANQQPRFTTVNLPPTLGADGQVVPGGQAVLDNQTKQWMYPGQQQGARPAPQPPAKGATVERNGSNFRFKGGDPSKPESWEKV